MTDFPLARISLKFSMIEEPSLSLSETFDMLAQIGFDGVEIDAPGPLDPAALRRASAASGVALPGVINSQHWLHPLTANEEETREKGLDGMRAAMRTASEIGAETVLLVPGKVTAAVSYAQAFERTLAALETLLPEAEALGVKIALENVWNDFLLSPLEAVRLLDHFDHPHLGWYLDIGNLLKFAHPQHWIETLGPRILRVDLKDYSRTKMDAEGPWKGFDVELGEGEVNWPGVNAALRKAGYSGWASAEVPGGGKARLKDIRDRIERLRAL